jgi:hypothetical protein
VIEVLLLVVIMLDLLFKGILLMRMVRLGGNTSEWALFSLAGVFPIDITIGAKVIVIIIIVIVLP